MDLKIMAVYYAVSLISLIVYVFYRIYLAKTVELVLLAKKIENHKAWKVLTFFFGLIVVAICFIINRKVGEPISEKVKPLLKKYFINVVVFGLISLAFIPVDNYSLNKINGELSKASLNSDIVYFDEENDVYYCYDKMGNTYTSDNIEDFKYYDADGNAYFDSSYEMAYYCTKTDKTIEYCYAYINEAGNIVEINSELPEFEIDEYDWVYYDDRGNLYYYPGDCSWDENGNLLFDNKDISNLTYSDIVKS